MVAPGYSKSGGGMKKGNSATVMKSNTGMTAEQKIAKRRAEQQANPERFQSVIKNKNKVTKKLGNMGQDFRSVDKVVKADRENRRKTGDGEFGRARQAAMTRELRKKTAAALKTVDQPGGKEFLAAVKRWTGVS